MGNVRIVADSTCDLSPELIANYGITIIPLCIIMDGKSYYDWEETTPEEIFAWADEHKTTPGTAAVTFEILEQRLTPMIEAGDDIIFLGISEDMSTTCNVVRMFAEEKEYKRLFVVNSMNLSTGIGLQVLKAAEMAAEGATAEEIVEAIEAARDRVRASFIVDTLTYLARGGRCSAVAAFLGNALKIHPMIAVKNGKMGVAKKYRGNMTSSMERYMNDLREELANAETKRVFITHPTGDRELPERARKFLEELGIFDEICETFAGGVISSHCGPGTIGILFYVKE
ncbi:MAG: DegV family protein [Lachnospiraceae bacterium]|nr:DegV family protein [Lachnospiraceae bacterium]